MTELRKVLVPFSLENFNYNPINTLQNFFRGQNLAALRLTVFLTVNSRCQVNSLLPRLIPIPRNVPVLLVIDGLRSARHASDCAVGIATAVRGIRF